jgi:glycosyltransferase involved in cell wall biosynthesis
MNRIEHPLFSVVICTYNRASFLRTAVKSVLDQKIAMDSYELIIVDNASTDETREVVRELSGERNNVSYVFEEKQGLSHARNRGWKEARGDYVIYIDDECILPSGYLEIAFRIHQQHSPDIFGGQIKSFYDYKKPRWIKDEYYSDFLTRKTEILSHVEFVYGGNMGIRREILSSLGGFNPDLGMKAEALSFAEEVEFQQRAFQSIPDLKVLFDSDLWLYHQVRKEKVNLKWIFKYHFFLGLRGFEGYNNIQTYKRMSGGQKFARIIKILVGVSYRIFRICVRVPILMFWRSEKYPYWQQYLVEKILGIEVKMLGVYWAEIRYIFSSLQIKEDGIQ